MSFDFGPILTRPVNDQFDIGELILFMEYFKDVSNKNLGVPKVYFKKCLDEQTQFDRLSNQHRIAVIAPTDKLAKIMLRLVRIVVDVDYNLLLLDAFSGNVPKIAGAVLCLNLMVAEDDNIESYDIAPVINGQSITNIDIWTLPRLVEQIPLNA